MSDQPELPELSFAAFDESEPTKGRALTKHRATPTAQNAERYAQLEFFPAEFYDVSVKDDHHTMEHPFFSLKTQKDTAIRYYTHNGVDITVTPSVVGMATIWDKDLLIFATSQLVEAINREKSGKPTPSPRRVVRFSAYSFLVATGRTTGGKDYAAILKSLERLKGTVIQTNLKTGGKIVRRGFNLIEDWTTVEDESGSGIGSIEITLSAWLYEAVQALEVLTLNRAYFKIRGGVEKRLYEIARKHCGSKSTFQIGEEALFKKTGSTGSIREFRRALKDVITKDSLPDYRLKYDETVRKVTVYTKDMKALSMEALKQIVAA